MVTVAYFDKRSAHRSVFGYSVARSLFPRIFLLWGLNGIRSELRGLI
jgi:hypothetical protein